VKDGVVNIEYIPITEMAVDCLTKPLKKALFKINLKALEIIKK
jgi:hypothetical protein